MYVCMYVCINYYLIIVNNILIFVNIYVHKTINIRNSLIKHTHIHTHTHTHTHIYIYIIRKKNKKKIHSLNNSIKQVFLKSDF